MIIFVKKLSKDLSHDIDKPEVEERPLSLREEVLFLLFFITQLCFLGSGCISILLKYQSILPHHNI